MSRAAMTSLFAGVGWQMNMLTGPFYPLSAKMPLLTPVYVEEPKEKIFFRKSRLKRFWAVTAVLLPAWAVSQTTSGHAGTRDRNSADTQRYARHTYLNTPIRARLSVGVARPAAFHMLGAFSPAGPVGAQNSQHPHRGTVAFSQFSQDLWLEQA